MTFPSEMSSTASLSDFATASRGAEAGLFFYAGHGLQYDGKNYLIPVDAKISSPASLDSELVFLDHIQQQMEREARVNLMFFDACRDNPFAPQIKKTAAPEAVAAASTAGGNVGTRSLGRGLGEVKVQGASLVVFAAKHGQTALDGEGGNSPFALGDQNAGQADPED